MTLKIYPVVLELVRRLAPLLPALRRRSSALADQMERALISVPLNVALAGRKLARPIAECDYRYAVPRALVRNPMKFCVVRDELRRIAGVRVMIVIHHVVGIDFAGPGRFDSDEVHSRDLVRAMVPQGWQKFRLETLR
jgi:hypothetical protein